MGQTSIGCSCSTAPCWNTAATSPYGLDVLDIGCGEGRFCRMLFQRGAQVTGLDPTPNLLTPQKLRDPGGHYVDGSGESLPIPAHSFDLVVSYLVLIDIPDFRAAIREMARVLRPGGRAVVASHFPYATCGAWVLDEDQRLLYRTIDHYFGERPERYSWGNIEVVNWHRPLEAYFQAFLASGLNFAGLPRTLPFTRGGGECTPPWPARPGCRCLTRDGVG